MDVFLSFSFRPEDRELVGQLESLLRSHGIRPVTGRSLDGEAVTPAVFRKVEASDAVVSLMSRRDQIPGGDSQPRWRTHPWVRDEINHARGRGMRTIALLEDGVEPEGAYLDHERIPLSREHPLPAFLKLSETLAGWKRSFGRRLMASILPPSLGHDVVLDPSFHCQYRFWSEGRAGDWRDGNLVPAEGGTLLYIGGVHDDNALIEVRVNRHGQTAWRSVATSQRVTINLKGAGE